ncbi:P-type DNA transfer protein VirB5 [Acidovorax sp. HMWF018]|jgi:type IV secretion system protein VirB5|uniref:type IV secretion system protein n=1 Tax=Acidovorax sp. HMWF018 TaxID=2056855 RepID=UPI000D392C93|nr:type IV secretion system protein [Acidovorax sp. HMWF018]PTT38823.1 P-type DNA transfer protein VirB5 [Acidovorax sp. HMWF018]
MKIKNTLAAVATATGLSLTTAPAFAFFGFSNIATETTQIASWAAQYIQMLEEYNQLVEEYRSLNGMRGMASLVNNPQLRRYLPDEYKNVLSQGYGDWQALRGALDNPIGSANLDKQRRDQLAIDEAMALESYKQASRRFGDIQVLLDKINDASTPDAKDMADLQARIQAEQVMLQNEATKIAMLKNLQEIQQRKQTAQGRANVKVMRNAPGSFADIRTEAELFGNIK